jgi:heptosyltransferase-2
MMDNHFENKFLVGFASDSRWKTKMWGVNKYSALAKEILSWNKDAILFLFGEDKEIGSKIEAVCPHKIYDLMGKLTIKETMALISFMNIFVSNDSGLMHIANAFRVPLVAIFGPTVREFGFFPRGEEVRIMEVDVPCRPCSLHGTDVCKKDYQCMKMISVDDAFKKVKEVSQYATQRTRSSISSYK